MPDKSANGMFEYAKSIGLDWGTIDSIPEIPGIAVRYDGHVGVYIGNGKVVEERGFNYGCVMTDLKGRGWLNWYKIPTINYVEGSSSNSSTSELKLGDRLLKEGSIGEDVKELQHLMNQYLNLTLKEDGDFGPATLAAVKQLQNKLQLNVDGKYGAQTHSAFMSALSDEKPDEQPIIVPDVPKQTKLKTNCAANVRAGDSTAYSVITTLKKDTILTPILDANGNIIMSANKWYAIKCNDKIGWISESVVNMEG